MAFLKSLLAKPATRALLIAALAASAGALARGSDFAREALGEVCKKVNPAP